MMTMMNRIYGDTCVVEKIFNKLFLYRKTRSRGYGWRKIRNGYIAEHPRCEICGYYSLKNDVHHIIPRHIAPERILDKENLMTLCRKYRCHLRFGHFGNYTKYYNPDIEILKPTGQYMAKTETIVKQYYGDS
jgi:hypothetical protein